jgi:hypothetical protein
MTPVSVVRNNDFSNASITLSFQITIRRRKNICPKKRSHSFPQKEIVALLPLIEFLNCLISNSCCWSLLSRWSSRLIIAAGSFSNKRLLFDIRTLLTRHKHNIINRCSSIVDLELYSVTLSYLLVIIDK